MALEEGPPPGFGSAAADHDPHLAMGTTSEAGQAFLQGLLQRIGMQPGALATAGTDAMPAADTEALERIAVPNNVEGLVQDPHAAVPGHDPLQIIHAALSQHVNAVGIAGLPPLPSLNHTMDSDIAAILAAVQEQAAGRAAPRPTPAAPTSSGNGAANGGESSSYLAQSGLPNAHAREKNRQAQRRFRERQKGTIAQLQAQVEELHMQLAARNLEVQRLEQENSLLRARLGMESAQSVLAQAAAAAARFPLQEAAATVARELEQQQQQQPQQQQQQQQPQQPFQLPPLHLHQPPLQQLGAG